jgi:hypothetical protein
MKLEFAANDYFRKKFGECFINIDFKEKLSGSQFGSLAIVDVVDERQKVRKLKFHLKTHRNGSAASDIEFSRKRQFDPMELFVYWLLYLLGLGPEVDFFGRNINDFYISSTNIEGFVRFYIIF